ncbi:hypothetical protein EYB53_021225 [Candidatus Chloroploca sp. M-50]|uniref:Uncharacterized protein n=1 Tax=Candidatus Chloroploca mongolica TaxID=2528176 RepID=A0ABS4DFM3_9CHLR|nr:hypothetical protein [Candidatus Chloroploca mongolica]MBP1468246.1 hypothetical protein [Candidatus Chloroploca mongolica]
MTQRRRDFDAKAQGRKDFLYYDSLRLCAFASLRQILCVKSFASILPAVARFSPHAVFDVVVDDEVEFFVCVVSSVQKSS